jgi:hypothetical protein
LIYARYRRGTDPFTQLQTAIEATDRKIGDGKIRNAIFRPLFFCLMTETTINAVFHTGVWLKAVFNTDPWGILRTAAQSNLPLVPQPPKARPVPLL